MDEFFPKLILSMFLVGMVLAFGLMIAQLIFKMGAIIV